MADEQYCPALLCHIAHFAKAFFLEVYVANGQYFIDDEDFRFQVSSDGKGETHIHAAGITLDRRINEVLDFGKSDNLIELPPYLGLFHAENGPIEINILPPGKLAIKARTHLQQRTYMTVD